MSQTFLTESDAEYAAALRSAVIFDRSDCGKIEVFGPEAATFLHNLCTNDVIKLQPGTGCAAYLTTGQAKIVALAQIVRPPLPVGKEGYWLDVGTGMGPKVAAHLDRYLISERLEIADRTGDYAQVHVAGPTSADVLAKVFGHALDLPLLLGNRTEKLGDVACQIRRSDPLGLPGYDVLCPLPQAEVLRSVVLEAGARAAGPNTYQVLRVEAGTPQYSLDIDETSLPQEIGQLERTVSFTKGCYIGQETVARIRTYGHVNRALGGLVVAEPYSIPRGAKIVRNGQEVGMVTSSVRSPRVGKIIALGYLRRGHNEIGTAVEIEATEERWTAAVVGLPFISSSAE
jgi:folate-binding protein YgfZ